MDYNLKCMKEIARVPYATNVITAVTSAEKQLKDAGIPLLSSALECGESVANRILNFHIVAIYVSIADWCLTKTLQVAFFCAAKTAKFLNESQKHTVNPAQERLEEPVSPEAAPGVGNGVNPRDPGEPEALVGEQMSPADEPSRTRVTSWNTASSGTESDWKTAVMGYDVEGEEDDIDPEDVEEEDDFDGEEEEEECDYAEEDEGDDE